MDANSSVSRECPAWESVIDAGAFGEIQVIAGTFDACEEESKRQVDTLRQRYGTRLLNGRLLRQIPKLVIVSLDELNIPAMSPNGYHVVTLR